MVKLTPFVSRKSVVVLRLLGIVIFIAFLGCKKTATEQIVQKENIQLSEILQWNQWYEKTIPNAPKLLISKAEKTFFQNRFYVRIPVLGSTGMMYFGKSQSLEAIFMRINPSDVSVSYPFTGNYEFIDMNKFTYKQINFLNGYTRSIFQSHMTGNVATQSSPTIGTATNWFSQLLYCIANYIIAVPAKINGEWGGCWVLGSGGMNEELNPISESGGNNNLPIDWSNFLLNINPPLTGPDPIPTGGNGNWIPYAPPAYVPPTDPVFYLSGLENTPLYNDFAEPPFIWKYSGDNNETYTDPDPNENCDFQFLPSDDYEKKYPKFNELVKNLKTFVVGNPEVLNALIKYSSMSKQTILNHLTYGQGAIIKVEEMLGRYGFYNKDNGNATLHINAYDVRDLENAQTEPTKQALAFLLGVTILHEFCHYGTASSNKSEGVLEFGREFEKKAFNIIVTDNNAGQIVIKFSKYF